MLELKKEELLLLTTYIYLTGGRPETLVENIVAEFSQSSAEVHAKLCVAASRPISRWSSQGVRRCSSHCWRLTIGQ
jgi:hypothetical protein